MNVYIGFVVIGETVVSYLGLLDDRIWNAILYRLEAVWSVMWLLNVLFWDIEERYVGYGRFVKFCSGVLSVVVGLLLR